ncbi:hypothetical protein JKP88DRAFT_302496 [Tribonema minus]|uniref:PHD-type domain-containing protein n=1 Tax=Tribonema minus TaxID=303371 RepID=A0A836CJU8_9STRA|nr:hypothetical protein JKP88DRAFT_302496 [Tribonema minus]
MQERKKSRDVMVQKVSQCTVMPAPSFFDLGGSPDILNTNMAAVRDLDALLQSLYGHLDEEGAKVCKAAQALLEAAKPSTRHSKQLQKQQQQKPQRAKGRGSGGKRKRADADPAADAAGELAEALRQMGVAMEAKHGLCLELGGQKLRLAQLTYDAIDLHVQRADRELARMEVGASDVVDLSWMRIQNTGRSWTCAGCGCSGRADQTPVSMRLNLSTAQRSPPQCTRLRTCLPAPQAELKRDGQLQTAPAAGAQLAAAAAAAADGDATAASEPLYCVCRQIAFGDMVACDDADCPAEWFHPRCVGLTRLPPAGTPWFCPDCAERRAAAAAAEAEAAEAAAAEAAAAAAAEEEEEGEEDVGEEGGSVAEGKDGL